MSKDFYWDGDAGTQKLEQKVQVEIDKAKDEITDEHGLLTSPSLEREYCRAHGYLSGLRKLKEFIKEVKEEMLNESL